MYNNLKSSLIKMISTIIIVMMTLTNEVFKHINKQSLYTQYIFLNYYRYI